MRSIGKAAMILALGGALAASTATASSARGWRPWAAAGAGFVAGAAIGSAAAASANGYYYDRGYAPGYAYGPGYYGAEEGYAYAPSYSAPSYYPYRSRNPADGCSSTRSGCSN